MLNFVNGRIESLKKESALLTEKEREVNKLKVESQFKNDVMLKLEEAQSDASNLRNSLIKGIDALKQEEKNWSAEGLTSMHKEVLRSKISQFQMMIKTTTVEIKGELQASINVAKDRYIKELEAQLELRDQFIGKKHGTEEVTQFKTLSLIKSEAKVGSSLMKTNSIGKDGNARRMLRPINRPAELESRKG